MDIEKMYDTGYQAYERGNYEYAVEMFKRIVAIEPEHVKARKALRATARKIVGKSKPGFGASLKAAKLQIQAGLLGAKKEYKKILEHCEEYLIQDPKNKTILTLLGQTALKAELFETAAITFEDLAAENPKDKKILRSLALAYTGKNDFENAIQSWQKVIRINSGDNEARQAVKELAAKQSLDETWDGKDGQTKDFTSKIKSEKDAKRARRRDQRIRTAEELDEAVEYAREDLAASPRNLKLMMELGDLLRRKGDEKEARSYYQMALDTDPSYYHARNKIGDMEIGKRTRMVEKVKTTLLAKPSDPTLRKEYAETRKQQLVFEIQEYERRAKENPTDMSFRYRLGRLYLDGGLLDKAIGAFQRSRKDPKIKNESLVFLGTCFIRRKEFAAAVEQLTDVVESIRTMNVAKKNALYNRAEAYLGMGDIENARQDFMAIYLEDIGFKDVSERIKKLNQEKPKSE